MMTMNHLARFGGIPLRAKPFPEWPTFSAAEEDAVLRLLRSGKWWANSLGESRQPQDGGDEGSRVAQLERAFAQFHDAKFAVACASGTAALEVALKAAGVGAGDEVIVPPYTFIATANAPLLLGATPVFCDIELDTLNLDARALQGIITPRTKAIIPVHFAGRAADMDSILAIARLHNLFVLEDAAHAHGAAWKERGLGSIGDAGAFSFQASKNMTAGEGGMILTNDQELAEICESYVWVGRKVGRPWYEHHRLGWNYRMMELQAAILIEQLKHLPAQLATRTENAAYLNLHLGEVPGITALPDPSWASTNAHHIYLFRFDQQEFGISRDEFLLALAAEGIPCTGGYAFPLYRNPLFLAGNEKELPRVTPPIDWEAYAASCPNAEQACREMVWIEHRVLLGSREDMEQIVQAVMKIYLHRLEFSCKEQSTVAS
jgi:dTDP-4-amino-4,6-dideoxygalactose transaminase